jgi:general secretion pathway protein D
VEVSNETAEELGIQWNFLIGSGNQNVGFGSTNFGPPGQNQGAGGNILGLNQNVNAITNSGTATGLVVPPAPGLNLGLISRFNGAYAMSALVRALQTASGTNILSTPNLITLDNEEARIIVGQNVPILTGSYSTTGSTSTVTPFQTYVRQDVGILLRVRPQISDNGIVKMQIYQEVSSVAAQTTSGIVLNKRNIESNVLVDDGQMVVLGGLISDEYSDGTSGIPFLSSIPLIGQLFRYDNKNRVKRNLLVFMRPYVLRDKNQTDEITSNRLNLMQSKEDQFKQLPMLLPKETGMPNIENAAEPLVTPRLPANSINPPAVTRPPIPGGSSKAPTSSLTTPSAN